MSWSALQREALEAMGFAVLLPRSGMGVAEVAIDAATDVDMRETGASRRVPGRSEVTAASASVTASQARAEPRPAVRAQGGHAHANAHANDRLARALLRAAGRTPDAADAPALLAQWPDPAQLRRDPAAKRALWPQLRALRRAGH